MQIDGVTYADTNVGLGADLIISERAEGRRKSILYLKPSDSREVIISIRRPSKAGTVEVPKSSAAKHLPVRLCRISK